MLQSGCQSVPIRKHRQRVNKGMLEDGVGLVRQCDEQVGNRIGVTATCQGFSTRRADMRLRMRQ